MRLVCKGKGREERDGWVRGMEAGMGALRQAGYARGRDGKRGGGGGN